MSAIELNSKVIETKEVPLSELHFDINKDLKRISEHAERALATSFLRRGIINPFTVWVDGNGKNQVLDGWHRYSVLEKCAKQGLDVYLNADLFEQLKALLAERPAPASDDMAGLLQLQWQGGLMGREVHIPKEWFELPKEYPCTFVQCESEQKAKELVLAYSDHYAQIDKDLLSEFVADMDIEDVLSALVLPDVSIDKLLQSTQAQSSEPILPDEAPKSDIEVVVKPGDIFQVGEHIIGCGDTFDREFIAKIMGSIKAAMAFFDPPYNLPVSSFSGKGAVKHDNFATGGGELSDAEFVLYMAELFRICRINTEVGAVVYMFMDFRHDVHVVVGASLSTMYDKDAEPELFGLDNLFEGWKRKQLCVWRKDIPANGSFYRAQHECCHVYINGQEKAKTSKLELGDRYRTNVWDYPSATSFSNPDQGELSHHPTPKPVAMIGDAMLDVTNPGDTVIDFFSGSGSTMRACQEYGRKYRGCDIEPKYVQHAIVRLYEWLQKENYEPVPFKHLNGDLTLNQILQNGQEPK